MAGRRATLKEVVPVLVERALCCLSCSVSGAFASTFNLFRAVSEPVVAMNATAGGMSSFVRMDVSLALHIHVLAPAFVPTVIA